MVVISKVYFEVMKIETQYVLEIKTYHIFATVSLFQKHTVFMIQYSKTLEIQIILQIGIYLL